MAFGDELELLLPPYLTASNKSRLTDALAQFVNRNERKEIDYEDFYKDYNHPYFLQSDTVKEIRFAEWNFSSASYEKAYTDAIIISNTCDISFDNIRTLNAKQCLMAPLIEFEEYLKNLISGGYTTNQIATFTSNVKSQLTTNIFYLPADDRGGKEYLVLLDHVFWFPTSELNTYRSDISRTRIVSLSHFGHYLFLLKLSYHLCRLPEQCDREVNI
jgi:hypothetical protein